MDDTAYILTYRENGDGERRDNCSPCCAGSSGGRGWKSWFSNRRVPRVDEWFAADRAQAALLPGNRRRHRAHPG
jgi:hypothetical protein